MYHISKACFHALFNPSRVMTAKAAITTASGAVITLAPSDFKSGGIRLSEATSGSGSFDLGAAVIGKLTLTLNNSDGRFNHSQFIGGQVSAMQIGVTLPDNSTEWIPLGVFDIDSVKYSGTAAEIVAYDMLGRADRGLPAVSCPVTLGNLVRSVCTYCGIIWCGQSFLNDGYTVEVLPEKATCRDVISYAAALAGCYARMNREGVLTFGWYGYDMPLWGAEAWLDGGVFLDMSGGDDCDGGDFLHYDDDLTDGGRNDFRGFCTVSSPKSIAGNKPVTVSGLLFTQPDGESATIDGEGNEVTETVPGNTYIYGTEDYCFDLSRNPLLTHDIPDILASIGGRLAGETFHPISLTCVSNPAFEAGDIVKAADRRGNTYTAYINRCEYRFGASQSLSCEARTGAEKAGERYSYVTRLEQKIKSDTDSRIKAYGSRIQTLNNLMLHALGVYKTAVQNEDGSITYYTHDKPTLAASSYIACETANGFAYTTSGWNEGSPVWQYGMTSDGNIICNVLSAVGIVADWIQAGRIESADGSCYFDLDSNQLFASKIGLPTRFLSSGNVQTDTGESRAGIACFDTELSGSPYFQIRPIQAQADGELFGFGFADQLGRVQMLSFSRSDNAEKNGIAIYGYDASDNRHEMMTVSALVGGVRLASIDGQNRIEITDAGIEIYSGGTLVQSW